MLPRCARRATHTRRYCRCQAFEGDDQGAQGQQVGQGQVGVAAGIHAGRQNQGWVSYPSRFVLILGPSDYRSGLWVRTANPTDHGRMLMVCVQSRMNWHQYCFLFR